MDIILTLFKLDIGVTSTAKDELYLQKINSAISELQEKGIDINLGSVADQMLIIDLAVWNYRNEEKGANLCRNLEFRIANRKAKARAQDV